MRENADQKKHRIWTPSTTGKPVRIRSVTIFTIFSTETTNASTSGKFQILQRTTLVTTIVKMSFH